MGRVLAGLATLLIIILAAAFIAPVFVDWSNYRSEIEEAATAVIGRPVKTKGSISLTLLPEPRLRVEGVSVGQRGQSTLTADAADISLALPSLLSGVIEAQSIKLVRPNMEVNLTQPEITGAPSVSAMKTAVRVIRVENGTVSILYRQGQDVKRVAAEQINGVISSQDNNPYRFAGRFASDGISFDLKSSVALASANKARISATFTNLSSKNTFQIDGSAFNDPTPVFEGSVASTFRASISPSDEPVEIQSKAVAHADMDGIALANLVVTVDPQKRLQILTGTAQADFISRKASLDLEAKSFDVDGFLPSPTEGKAAPGGLAGARAFGESLLWSSPEYDFQLSLKSEQTQIQGELLTGLTLDADRSQGRWTVQRAAIVLPGDTTFVASGTLGKTGPAIQVSGIASAEGQNFGRFARWVNSPILQGKRVSSKPFSVKGSFALSPEAVAFEGVTATIGETPFSGSLRVENGPPLRVTAVIEGDTFDFGDINPLQGAKGSESLDFASVLRGAGLSQSLPGLTGLQIGQTDLTVAAKSIKTASFEALNVTGRVKISPELISVSKLNVETTDGLAIQGDGSVPLQDGGRGTFEGRVEAKTAGAFLEVLSIAGLRDRFGSRNPGDFIPVKADLGISSNGADVTFRSKGDAAGTRIDADGQVRFQTAEGKPSAISVNLNASSADGQKLATQLFPSLAQTNGTGAGSVAARVSGPLAKLNTSVAVQVPQVQARFDGVTNYVDGAFSALGKASAATVAPQVLLDSALLPLLGVDGGGDLRLEATVSFEGGRVIVDRFRSDAGRNAATGKLVFETAPANRLVEGDIKADQISLPALLATFVVPTSPDAAAGYWSQQPFLMSAFDQNLRLSITARSLRIGDGLQLSQAQAAGAIANRRFELTKLTGKLAGGDFIASGDLAPQGGIVVLNGKVAVTGADLSQVLAGGVQPPIVGKASLFSSLSGQALSPKALIAVLSGRGVIGISDGFISRVTPALIARTADEALTSPSLTEDVLRKRLADATQLGDFRFRRERIPFTIDGGVLQIRRAALRSPRDGSVRLSAFVEVATGNADATLMLQPVGGRQNRWPDVRVSIAGQLRDLAAAQKTVDVDDIARASAARRAENDLKRLESLNKTAPVATLPWTATTQDIKPSSPLAPLRKIPDIAEDPPAAKPPRELNAPAPRPQPSFEDRMRALLQSESSGVARGQTNP